MTTTPAPANRSASPPKFDVFWGKTSQNVANVFVRVREQLAETRLRGSIYGPQCRYSRTLPGRSPLVDLGLGETLLGEMLLGRALVPDPCFWSPALPFLYHVEIELVREEVVVARGKRLLGIRMFGTSGRDLRLEGRRWVARGTRIETTDPLPLEDFHDASLVACVPQPDDALCRQASEVGTMIFARIGGSPEQLRAEAERLARWPAVAVLILPATAAVDEATLATAPNMVWAASGPAETLVDPPSWAAALVLELGDSTEAARPFVTGHLPVIIAARHNLTAGGVEQQEASRQSGSELRAGCDRLQSLLAAMGDFAGYFSV